MDFDLIRIIELRRHVAILDGWGSDPTFVNSEDSIFQFRSNKPTQVYFGSRTFRSSIFSDSDDEGFGGWGTETVARKRTTKTKKRTRTLTEVDHLHSKIGKFSISKRKASSTSNINENALRNLFENL